MNKLARQFRYALIAGTIALALPAHASACDCQDQHARSKQPGAITTHNEMRLLMPQGMPHFPPCAMMAQPPFPPDGKLIPPFLRDLKLTEQQQDKVFELMHSQMPILRERHKAVRKTAQELNRLTASDHYTPSELRTLADKLARALADSFVLDAVMEVKILTLLTAEQRKQADEMRSEFRAPPYP